MMPSMANIEIGTLIKRGYLISTLLGITTVILIYFLYESIHEERNLVERKVEFSKLGHNIEIASDTLTNEARVYTVMGDEAHYKAYMNQVKAAEARRKILNHLGKMHATKYELSLIKEAESHFHSLINIEKAAFSEVANGNMEEAKRLLFNETYINLKRKVKRPIQNFLGSVNARAVVEIEVAEKKAVFLLEMTIVMFVLFTGTVATMMHSIFVKNISRPLDTISKAILAISQGHTDIDIPYADAKNEIGTLAGSAVLFKESLINNKKLAATNQNLAVELSTSTSHMKSELERQAEEMKEMSAELRALNRKTTRELQGPLVASIKQLEQAKEAIVGNNHSQVESNLKMAEADLYKLDRLIDEAFEISDIEAMKAAEENEKEVEVS